MNYKIIDFSPQFPTLPHIFSKYVENSEFHQEKEDTVLTKK